MKKAIGYARISMKDQSNFSLEGQQRFIGEYAQRRQYDLLEIFTDDGRSARSFDRPNWKELERFIKEHYPAVQVLIVVWYNRFSRNAAEGLAKITYLEKRFNIIIVSVFEEMYVDIDSPYFFKQRADMLVNAEYELHVIKDRCKMGINQALSSGRYINRPPRGYLAAKDDKKRLLIVPDPATADVIRFIFKSFANGWTLGAIKKAAGAMGLKLMGNSAIPRILANCTYAGLIHVPRYRQEQEQLVPGQHQALVEPALWHRVQAKLKVPTRVNVHHTDEAPLRGLLQCPTCLRMMTAGASKGKFQYYWYYKCNTHTNINQPAKKLHEALLRLLATLSLPPHYLVEVERIARHRYTEQLELLDAQRRELAKALVEINRNIDNTEQRFIAEQITLDVYSKWRDRYLQQKEKTEADYNRIGGNVEEKWAAFETGLPHLADLRYIYTKAAVPHKQQFLNLVFDNGLWYSEGSYRTPSVHGLFAPQVATAVGLGLLVIEKKSPEQRSGDLVERTGVESNSHISLFDVISQIVAA